MVEISFTNEEQLRQVWSSRELLILTRPDLSGLPLEKAFARLLEEVEHLKSVCQYWEEASAHGQDVGLRVVSPQRHITIQDHTPRPSG